MKKAFLFLITASLLLGSCPAKAVDFSGFWNTYKQPISWLIAGAAVAGSFLSYAYYKYCQDKKSGKRKKTTTFITSKTPIILPQSDTLYDRIAGSMIAGAVGDALGRPTEFIKSVDAILKQYPNGIRSFADFKRADFRQDSQGNAIAPYTDDTAMAQVTAEVLLNHKNSNDLENIMDELARAYVQNMNRADGWAASYRAPGNTCLSNVRVLQDRIDQNKTHTRDWWKVSMPKMNQGGCGSVMHAHPFGLIFYQAPEKAALWAAEHSYLTHGAPMAVAACAAMAGGIACAMQDKTPDEIVSCMIRIAYRHDVLTAQAMKKAHKYAQEHRAKIETMQKTIAMDRSLIERNLAKPVYEEFLGWDARTAIAATVYTFLMAPDSPRKAIYLGVHTPGDSDSIASMAGALVGARVGYTRLTQEWPELELNKLEGYSELMHLSQQMPTA